MQVPRRAGLGTLLVAAALAGCAVPSTQAPADDARALADALAPVTSAVETALVATDLLDRDRATATTVDTALLDQLNVLQDAAGAVATLVPAPGPGTEQQAEALAAVHDAEAAVAAARAWATGAGGSAAEVTAALDEAATIVDDLSTALEQAS
ncbi:hypothetical protein OMK64_10810 [Cellulomonas fimi]|uniref:hypothetical protein n=1 Tax=Cellulomonas fimi TaxID=1708 RepID=UPI00234D3456|nr:hypothetical protein [Cellulomonas fimi]MDC7122027.1 hypothetical protein [Cellulomonas fimi]